MANDTNIRGVFPIHAPDSPPRLHYLRANTAIAIFRGQPVFINNSAQVTVVQVDSSLNTNIAVGVAWDFLDTNRAGLPSGMTTTSAGAFLPSSTEAFVGFTYDPMQLYVMEEDTAGTALNVNSANQSIAWTYQATTGNGNTGLANITLLRATILSSTGNLFQLMGLFDIKNNDGTDNAVGNYGKWIVRIQRHQFGNAVVSVPQ